MSPIPAPGAVVQVPFAFGADPAPPGIAPYLCPGAGGPWPMVVTWTWSKWFCVGDPPSSMMFGSPSAGMYCCRQMMYSICNTLRLAQR